MSGYRRGTVLGLTIAETFILLTFLLLIALLGLVHRDEPFPEPATPSPPQVWVRPEEIEALVNAAEAARKAQEEAERARAAAEREYDQARRDIEALMNAAEAGRKAQEEAERARAAAEREYDQARRDIEALVNAAEAGRKAQEEAERARAAAEREYDQARRDIEALVNAAEAAHKAQEEAERARAAAEREYDQARRDLALLRRKGKNPPCWYRVVSAGEGKTREKPYYAFNVAIYEDGIELAPRTAPPGGAFDDGGGPYADEWKRLRIEELPYGKALSDSDFTKAVSDLVAQGRNRQVRTYECVFSVMVWDKTPDHAKKRWKGAHDRIIEGSFSAYTVRDLEWKGVGARSAAAPAVYRRHRPAPHGTP